jgi:quinol monooxygenase YgiN
VVYLSRLPPKERIVIIAVARTTSPGPRTEEQNRLFQSLYEEVRALPGCEAVIVARSFDEAADITNAVTIFRWRDDAAMQAAMSRVQEVAEQMGQAVPGLAAVTTEVYELATDL